MGRFGAIARMCGSPVPGAPVAANSLACAIVIHGDTIDIQGQRVRLFDVDAPEFDQTCTHPEGTVWPCGQQAALTLTQWMAAASLAATNSKNSSQQWIAHCVSDGEISPAGRRRVDGLFRTRVQMQNHQKCK
jgi:endonuclease YncB( thermonuclease family)